MVDSPAAPWMDELAHLRERVTALEEKLELKTDAMRVRVDREVVDISEAFAQQQRFTIELVHDLEQKVDEKIAALDKKFTQKFDTLEAKMDAGFTRLESKLDLFIDAQTTFNQLVDARLRGSAS